MPVPCAMSPETKNPRALAGIESRGRAGVTWNHCLDRRRFGITPPAVPKNARFALGTCGLGLLSCQHARYQVPGFGEIGHG